jgi:aryl sulfotransferase
MQEQATTTAAGATDPRGRADGRLARASVTLAGVACAPFRYQSPDEDSARWLGFPFRDGDIVISARPKTGTTWVQMICALLIFQTTKLPAPLWHLSPWLDHRISPQAEVHARLAAQQHRRFIKTHTPLDGIPLDPRVTYIVMARHPLDMFVSLYHQDDNINRALAQQLTGHPRPPGGHGPAEHAPPGLPGLPRPAELAGPSRRSGPREPLHDVLLDWIADDSDPPSTRSRCGT